jgi:hypothetical protein
LFEEALPAFCLTAGIILRLIRLKFCSSHEVLCWLLFLTTPINMMKLNLFNADFFQQHNL